MTEITYTLDQESNTVRLTIDTAGTVNTIGQEFIADLERCGERAIADKASGVIFTSGKKRSFLDGANLQEILTDATPQMIRSVSRRYQEALATFAAAPFPVVAILDGHTALGGGFELLLLACDHVFAAPGSKMGLPETNVGLFPAGGGTQTLRKVVGFKTAVDMIMQARVSPAESFAETGFVTITPSEELEERVRAWLSEHRGIVNRNYDPDYTDPDVRPPEEMQRIINAARFRYTICPERPYFLAAIEALEAGLNLSFDDALRNEIDLFAPLLQHPNSRNKIDLFFLMTGVAPKLAKVDKRKAVDVDRLAVIGAGLMGQGIAQIAADRGVRVTLTEVDEASGEAARESIAKTLEGLVSKGRWSAERKKEVMGNISVTADYEKLADAQLVVECVFEDLPLKQRVLRQLQEVNPSAIFASNTSTLPMEEISEGAIAPENVAGMHFFSPVPLMPLLEVVQGPNSGERAVATAVASGRALGKTVILVNDGPGFYTSRTFGAYVMNGLRTAELGTSPWDVDLIAARAGFPQGPLHVYGTTGGNVIYHANSLLADRFPERLHVPETLERLHKAGYVGAGKPSFYLDPKKMILDESVLEHVARAEGLPTPEAGEVRDILLLGMVNEAFWCLSDEVLRDYYSMELGAVLGIGFPDCWHGPGRYVSLKGVTWVKSRLEELSEKFELSSLTPAPEFDRLIACGLDCALV